MTVKSQLDTGSFWELFGDNAVLERVVALLCRLVICRIFGLEVVIVISCFGRSFWDYIRWVDSRLFVSSRLAMCRFWVGSCY